MLFCTISTYNNNITTDSTIFRAAKYLLSEPRPAPPQPLHPPRHDPPPRLRRRVVGSAGAAAVGGEGGVGVEGGGGGGGEGLKPVAAAAAEGLLGRSDTTGYI